MSDRYIDRCLDVVKEVWKQNPELRLGQLFEVAHHMANKDDIVGDLFSISNADLLAGLLRLTKDDQAERIESLRQEEMSFTKKGWKKFLKDRGCEDETDATETR